VLYAKKIMMYPIMCQVSFDHAKARKDGIIIPNKGVNPAYDGALSQVTRITQQLDEYLQQQKKRLSCKVSHNLKSIAAAC